MFFLVGKVLLVLLNNASIAFSVQEFLREEYFACVMYFRNCKKKSSSSWCHQEGNHAKILLSGYHYNYFTEDTYKFEGLVNL